jgi:hypothetical protein
MLINISMYWTIYLSYVGSIVYYSFVPNIITIFSKFHTFFDIFLSIFKISCTLPRLLLKPIEKPIKQAGYPMKPIGKPILIHRILKFLSKQTPSNKITQLASLGCTIYKIKFLTENWLVLPVFDKTGETGGHLIVILCL